eukprot:283055-Pyramimonas_sp.AAC.2
MDSTRKGRTTRRLPKCTGYFTDDSRPGALEGNAYTYKCNRSVHVRTVKYQPAFMSSSSSSTFSNSGITCPRKNQYETLSHSRSTLLCGSVYLCFFAIRSF